MLENSTFVYLTCAEMALLGLSNRISCHEIERLTYLNHARIANTSRNSITIHVTASGHPRNAMTPMTAVLRNEQGRSRC